ncbi:MAG: hypothetical protein COV69_00915 [Parcubacteria group bacterium CG11_big_fil_rev_8_21_14_0_20_39_14]|nr:MAG: hypothetical protein COV69_00915 [Parcubacteria group bacterium CG11_big_fil_rev_8_21_14_0_20_39_14]PIS35571.1 MAG: hypothetical protein COT36_01715 [Parcubacteria group bacterium CG08_land_8_20_14_0_20_38_56]
MRFNFKNWEKPFKIPGKEDKSLPEDYWFKIAEKLYQESGEIPDPLEIRAEALIKAFGIPSGQYSALELGLKKERINKEKDRIIAEYLTNKAGILIDKKTGATSFDFRDFYPKGLPKELKEILDPDIREIMETEYKHMENTRERFGNTKEILEADFPVNYFRLPGGIDIFLRGYAHDKQWQENHGEFLKKINEKAKVICIEGFADGSFGTSLDLYWSHSESQPGHYDALMHEAVDTGFAGLFTEIDARDVSKISMESSPPFYNYFCSELPSDFFSQYFDFLHREHPNLAKIIGSPKELKQVLSALSTTKEGIAARKKEIYRQGKCYSDFPYLSKEGKVSPEPTFLELGQHLFTDALSAIKLHLIAELMADGYIEKGPIIDYEGAFHLSNKSFFLRYPQYAMEVVLRTVNELMAGRVKEAGNIPEIYKVFENPDWSEITKEIARLIFKEPEKDPSKPTAIGPDQRQLIDKPIDFLEIYHINPQEIMPGTEKIKEIREKLSQEKYQ